MHPLNACHFRFYSVGTNIDNNQCLSNILEPLNATVIKCIVRESVSDQPIVLVEKES